MKLLNDYLAMRRIEMDEIIKRNPQAVPELGYLFTLLPITMFLGIEVIMWRQVVADWPPGFYPIKRFQELCFFIAALGSIGPLSLIGLGSLINTSGRINKYRQSTRVPS